MLTMSTGWLSTWLVMPQGWAWTIVNIRESCWMITADCLCFVMINGSSCSVMAFGWCKIATPLSSWTLIPWRLEFVSGGWQYYENTWSMPPPQSVSNHTWSTMWDPCLIHVDTGHLAIFSRSIFVVAGHPLATRVSASGPCRGTRSVMLRNLPGIYGWVYHRPWSEDRCEPTPLSWLEDISEPLLIDNQADGHLEHIRTTSYW